MIGGMSVRKSERGSRETAVCELAMLWCVLDSRRPRTWLKLRVSTATIDAGQGLESEDLQLVGLGSPACPIRAVIIVNYAPLYEGRNLVWVGGDVVDLMIVVGQTQDRGRLSERKAPAK
jgi:hypothetical protein